MLKAIKVRPDNLEYIMQYGKELNMNLADLKDNYELATEDGLEMWVITDGSLAKNNVTFTDMYYDFEQYWKFTKPEETHQFVEIERI